MRAVCASMLSGVSSKIPLGATGNPGCVGAEEWQGAQRCATRDCTAANCACGVSGVPARSAVGAERGPKAAAVAAKMSAPTTKGHGEVLPPRR